MSSFSERSQSFNLLLILGKDQHKIINNNLLAALISAWAGGPFSKGRARSGDPFFRMALPKRLLYGDFPLLFFKLLVSSIKSFDKIW